MLSKLETHRSPAQWFAPHECQHASSMAFATSPATRCTSLRVSEKRPAMEGRDFNPAASRFCSSRALAPEACGRKRAFGVFLAAGSPHTQPRHLNPAWPEIIHRTFVSFFSDTDASNRKSESKANRNRQSFPIRTGNNRLKISNLSFSIRQFFSTSYFGYKNGDPARS